MKTIEWEYCSFIDAAAIEAFEQEFGVVLPQALTTIARSHDGSVPHPARVAFPDGRRSSGYDIVGLGQLYRFVGKAGAGSSIADANTDYGDEFPGLKFFSEVPNGWGFALDYREGAAEPAIVFVRFDVDDGDAIVPVAKSFDALLEAVLSDDEQPRTVTAA